MGIVQFNEYGVLDTWFFILNQLLNILMGEEIQNSNFLLDQTKSLRAFISKIINFISSLIIYFQFRTVVVTRLYELVFRVVVFVYVYKY